MFIIINTWNDPYRDRKFCPYGQECPLNIRRCKSTAECEEQDWVYCCSWATDRFVAGCLLNSLSNLKYHVMTGWWPWSEFCLYLKTSRKIRTHSSQLGAVIHPKCVVKLYLYANNCWFVLKCFYLSVWFPDVIESTLIKLLKFREKPNPEQGNSLRLTSSETSLNNSVLILYPANKNSSRFLLQQHPQPPPPDLTAPFMWSHPDSKELTQYLSPPKSIMQTKQK